MGPGDKRRDDLGEVVHLIWNCLSVRAAPSFCFSRTIKLMPQASKSIPACFSVDGGRPGCFATVFDTGAGNGSFETPETGRKQLGHQVPNGAIVTTEVPGVMKLTVKAGSRVWIDRYRYAPPHGSVKGFNSGGVVFRYYRILFDAVKGEIGFSPAAK